MRSVERDVCNAGEEKSVNTEEEEEEEEGIERFVFSFGAALNC